MKKTAQSIIEKHISNGVIFVDPELTFIDDEVELGQGVEIAPFVCLTGKTKVGNGSIIGIFSNISSSIIGKNVEILNSTIEESEIEKNVKIGPYTHLRKGCYICAGAKIGNFSELKNTKVGKNTNICHLGYLGDSEIGENVNIGAGTITCNFDGTTKHKTVIGDNSFIGSNTVIVAPRSIGKNAFTGAGSVVTKDVESGALVYGVPAKKQTKR